RRRAGRRSRDGGACHGAPQGAERARRAAPRRYAARRLYPDRRKLQREPRLDARGARGARPGEARGQGTPHRRHRRHARTRRRVDRDASGTRGDDPRGGCRSRLRKRAAYARAFQGFAGERAGRLRGDIRGTRRDAARSGGAGRRGDGEGISRFPHGTDCRSAEGAWRRRGREHPAQQRGQLMLYDWLGGMAADVPALNVFRYITFRTGGATVTALLISFLFGPRIIALLRARQRRGQPIREDGPQTHIVQKQGTPTMGGFLILVGLVPSVLLWADLKNPYVWIVLC